MQITIRKMIGFSGLVILFPACVKKNSSVQLSVDEQVGFLEIYEEPEAIPLNTLIEKLREKVRDKMPKRLRPGLSMSETPPPYVACGQTVTIPGTHLCIFTTANGMNFALNRASQWVEAKELPSYLLLQEFQAYVLMQRSEFAVERFVGMAKQYQSRLKLKLTSNGIQLPDTRGGQG